MQVARVGKDDLFRFFVVSSRLAEPPLDRISAFIRSGLLLTLVFMAVSTTMVP